MCVNLYNILYNITRGKYFKERAKAPLPPLPPLAEGLVCVGGKLEAVLLKYNALLK